MIAHKYILKTRFVGMPKISDFEFIEETLPENLNENEILLKADFWSVDPYMRGFANQMNLGDTMIGSQVATVLKSKHAKFAEGSKVVAYVGWRDLTICNPDKTIGHFKITPLPNMHGLPESYGLGVLGMPGMTAYFGFTKICEPKAGETVVVSTAAGAVGSLVAQIAQIKGCKVVCFAGSDDKVAWLKEDLGIKWAFNYKEVHLDSILKKYALEGVDCYFDNVGGEFSYTVTKNMNQFGRISLCGAISCYNNESAETKIPFDYSSMIYKNIKMEGFMVSRWEKDFLEGIKQMGQWLKEGKIKVKETVTNGFENMPQAFIDILSGKNLGKAIIKA